MYGDKKKRGIKSPDLSKTPKSKKVRGMKPGSYKKKKQTYTKREESEPEAEEETETVHQPYIRRTSGTTRF